MCRLQLMYRLQLILRGQLMYRLQLILRGQLVYTADVPPTADPKRAAGVPSGCGKLA